MNDSDSTDGICDDCQMILDDCDCELHCPVCEDFMPRRHTCNQDGGFCDACGETVDDCACDS